MVALVPSACVTLSGIEDLRAGGESAVSPESPSPSPSPSSSADGNGGGEGEAGPSGSSDDAAVVADSSTILDSSDVDASSDGSSTKDVEPPPVDSGAPVSGTTVFSTSLASASDCSDWQIVAGSGSVTWASSGHAAGGSCRLCMSAASGELRAKQSFTNNNVTGKVVGEAWFLPVASSPAQTRISVRVNSGSDRITDSDLTSGWTRTNSPIGNAPDIVSGASPVNQITISVGTPSATTGQCLDFDDVRVVIQ
jgi:hypothetical protein